MNHKFSCSFSDNSGKKQTFTVSAKSKEEAIEKAFKKAKKNAKGDLSYCKPVETCTINAISKSKAENAA